MSKRLFAIPLIAIPLLALSGCGSPTRMAASFGITVKAACASGGYSDITAGAEVDISDSSGKIIGVGALGQGVDLVDSCMYVAPIINVLQTSDNIYRAHVGNSFRGELTGSVSGNEVTFIATLG